eukprot:CAMPEP_0115301558 /NCGR_PEP_ID=MMETSP0270-20121206/69921_1 /TAXON_ID=71861 /ORGANISM="Scrippsiella trochoidea, Strain CCMP3099" /LENGTH=220 /DNA_ID=CAMNT_0002719441 /DNA_START=118 /DNA_END=781 /DNA_ORIENTATION=-
MQVAHCKHTCCHSAYQLLEEALDSSGALECIPRLPGLQGVDEHLAEATASPRAIQPGSQCLWHHNTQVIEASLQRCRHCLSTLCLASPLLNSTPPSLRPLAYRLLLATCATSCCSIGSACAAGVALTEKLCGALWMSHCVNQKSSRSGGASQAAYSYGFKGVIGGSQSQTDKTSGGGLRREGCLLGAEALHTRYWPELAPTCQQFAILSQHVEFHMWRPI